MNHSDFFATPCGAGNSEGPAKFVNRRAFVGQDCILRADLQSALPLPFTQGEGQLPIARSMPSSLAMRPIDEFCKSLNSVCGRFVIGPASSGQQAGTIANRAQDAILPHSFRQPNSRPWRAAALALTCLLLAAPVFAAVDGVVTNGTTGMPQGGSTVTLFQTTNQGPQNLGSVKSDAQGKFVFTQDVQPGVGGGPLLLQAVYDGVQYSKTITPGSPTTGVEIPVFKSIRQQGDAKIQQHFLVLEPSPDGVVTVTEGVIYKNDGKTTWNDPDHGEWQFELPAAAQGKVEINVTPPGGLPIRRAPDPLGKPNQFKLDFPIKPGESEIQLAWSMPFNSPGVFEDHMLMKADLLRVVAPSGVQFKGDDVMTLGAGPSNSTIYSVKGPDVKFVIQGTGLFNQQQDDQGGGSNQSLSENMPKLYGLISANSSFGQSVSAVKWVLATVLGMLALGFILLYRKGNPADAATSRTGKSAAQEAGPETATATKATGHVRGRG